MFATVTYETIIIIRQYYQLLIQRDLLLVRSEQDYILQMLSTFEGSWTLIHYKKIRGFHAMNMESVSIQDGPCSKSTFNRKLRFVSQLV